MTTDPVDRLILDELGGVVGPVVVLDDATSHLTAACLDAGAEVRAHCDDLRHECAIPSRADIRPWGPELFAGARTVVARLPRSLNQLAEYAELIAQYADPSVRLVAGARIKHMTRTMNSTLERCFADVRASLGRNKSRVLHASSPRAGVTTSWPRTATVDVAGEPSTVVAHGAVFAGTQVDAGTRLLLDTLADHCDATGRNAVDFGCGSGLLSVWLARNGARVAAVDVSAAACASATATLAANDLTADVVRRDGLGDTDVDLIVSNPPFHVGAAKDSTPTMRMIDDAARVLRPGGELWMVYNAHLPYLPRMWDKLGEGAIVARDRSYLVVRGRK